MKELLQRGADPNAQEENTVTALMVTTTENIQQNVKRLIDAGADVNAIGKYGQSVLFFAAHHGSSHSLVNLLHAGADVNTKSQTGTTALFSALANGHYECAALLIKSGADVNTKNVEGNTPLNYAVSSGSAKCIALLLREDVSINEANEDRQNSIVSHLAKSGTISDESAMLLYAAGEMADSPADTAIPQILTQMEANPSLKHCARQAIRKHLIDLDPHHHLFNRIPALGLPPLLTQYLLFNVSLDSYPNTMEIVTDFWMRVFHAKTCLLPLVVNFICVGPEGMMSGHFGLAWIPFQMINMYRIKSSETPHVLT